ncbi:MAG TPA: hypothetical protein VFY31_09870 [Macromonas sp.]|nr:hypothetical protein [Macromonas sp.]
MPQASANGPRAQSTLTDADSQRDAAAALGESASEQGAPPSNTAPYTCNGGERGSSVPCPPLAFRLLRLGVDSLYLSYGGELSADTLDVLNRLKRLAQSEHLEEQVTAQYPAGEHIFTVYDKGERNFPFVIEDAAYRIKFSKPGKKLPMAYVKVSAYYLAHKSLQAVQNELEAILAGLGSVGSQLVSRIDLAVDFSSSVAMDGWGRDAWITRASDIDAYSKDQHFTGWTVGKGGAVSCRLYDKAKEIEKSGKTWLFDLWRPAGWVDGDPAWRLEFQFKRDFLKTRTLNTLNQVQEALNGLWSYACTEWLRLCLPSTTDSTRSRWPLHPLWLALSSVDWDSPQSTLDKVDLRTIPKEDWLKKQAFGLITTTMALHSLDDHNDALDRLMESVYEHYERVALRNGMTFQDYLVLHARKKARLFSSLLNKPGQVEDMRERFAQDLDNPYRKASKGE